jgi:hypothetical protein
MTQVFVNFPDLPDDCFRDDIDDALRGLLKGRGRVSGGGIALDGPGVDFDIELKFDNKNDVDLFISELVSYLKSLPAPIGTQVVVAGVEGEARIAVE